MSTASSETSKPAAKPLLGIRLRLMLLALLAVVPLTLDRVRVLETSRSERLGRAAAETMELARRGAEQQNEMVVTVRALIQAAARSYVTASAPGGGQCTALLDDFVKDIPWVSSLSVVGADGRIGCSTEPKAIGLDVNDRSYYRRALSSGQFVMSDYMLGRATGLSLVMASYATMTKEMQSVVVIAAMNLEWMGSFASLVSRRPGVVVNLVDANGTVLASYPRSDVAVGQEQNNHPLVAAMLSRPEGYITTEGFDGTRRVYGYVSLPWTSARLAVGLSEAELLKRIDRQIFIAYAQLAFFGLLALLAAWLAGEKLIVAPIRALARRAARFGRGEFDAPMRPITWIAEFRSLAAAFDDMADRLAERERELRAANLHLAELAISDELSGLGNRRGFDARLQAEWELAAELGRPIGLLMIDVDHFKLFNDRYGHLEGDHCLRGVGEVLSKISRGEADFPARYGGEEFVLLLPGAELESAVQVAERLRRTVECLSFTNTESPWGFVTVSIGVASLIPEKNASAEKLVEAADAGLYAAKRRGRNCVVAHDPVILSEAC
ncbi:MAG TPA: sensor domain-containing diguanylate cyclase [Xanthobacteraceae bacterium]|nr:sensor domain-containing diguanylate cyclase [Xanthobacteraceae bacterium]